MSSDNSFRRELVRQVHQAERAGVRSYYSIASETDFLVPGSCGLVTQDPRRQRLFSYPGHYGIIVSIRTWLNKIFTPLSNKP